MTAAFLNEPVKALILDIEGTTTSIDFVFNTLFPYSRKRAEAYLKEHWSEEGVLSDLQQLIAERQADESQGLEPPQLAETPESAANYLDWLIDRDRKSTPLKSIQGKIWEEGYRCGELKSHVFADVAPALSRWNEQGRRIYIYSSGSALAQRLLFAHTDAGDLTRLIEGYFDTTTGPKRQADSYRRIAEAIDLPPSQILFISDVTAELDAARAAATQTLLALRPGNSPQPDVARYTSIPSFDEVFP